MSMQDLPDIDMRICTVCGDCILACPTECLEIMRNIEIALSPQLCISCGICAAVCPVAAIEMRNRDW